MTEQKVAPLVFLDLETTGLDPDLHEAWEIAWAFDDEPVDSMFLVHSGLRRDSAADVVNHYLERRPEWATDEIMTMDREGRRAAYVERARARELESALILRFYDARPTIVSSAPSAVDIPFLRKRWHGTPWHHRTIDISTYAMPILGHDRPMGQWHVANQLREIGYDICLPDHTAAADVLSLRDCYHALTVLARTPIHWVMGAS